MRLAGLLLLATIITDVSMAGPIPGVPNDLRRQFKSVHKFQEVDRVLENQLVKARLDTSAQKPVLFYQIPQDMEDQALAQLVAPEIPQGLTLGAKTPIENGYQHQLILGEWVVEGAWLRVVRAEDSQIAIGLKLPKSASALDFPSGELTGLRLISQEIVAYRSEKQADNREGITFPEASGIKPRTIEAIDALLDPTATFERLTPPTAEFPDQIVVDEENRIWFTQPSNNFLTSFDPATNQWQEITVGAAPDGLFLDSQQRLWFGEYNDQHLGMYDPVTEVYQQFPMPYEDSTPAIPYEDHQGNIWVTDHQANKVAQLNLETMEWQVYTPEEDSVWVVQVIQLDDDHDRNIYGTHCQENAIGRIDYDSGVYDSIKLGVNTCPAFFAALGSDLFISLWSEGSIIKLDTAQETLQQFNINLPEEGAGEETGIGPLTKDDQGRIYFASLSRGRVYRFEPATLELVYVEGVEGTKDGIVVDGAGFVWVTEVNGSIVKVKFSDD